MEAYTHSKRWAAMLNGFVAMGSIEIEQFELGNKKVEFISPRNTEDAGHYTYHGNTMDWPGFARLPPNDKNRETKWTEALLTFERQTSFGQWTETRSTLNAVITIVY